MSRKGPYVDSLGAFGEEVVTHFGLGRCIHFEHLATGKVVLNYDRTTNKHLFLCLLCCGIRSKIKKKKGGGLTIFHSLLQDLPREKVRDDDAAIPSDNLVDLLERL